jgi:glutathione S-transferase
MSPLAGRVWITLLEKKITFKPIIVNLPEKEQFKPEFLQLNPFHHVPVIVDDGLRIIESLAILDYLEAKYPEVSLLPKSPEVLAKVRMAQMVTCSELVSQIIPLIIESKDSPKLAKAKRKIKQVMEFFSEVLRDDIYFGGNQFTLGDIVAGNTVILINKLGFELSSFPNIKTWSQRLEAREVWQKTLPSQEQLDKWTEFIRQWRTK